jgi:chemotaxis protein MotB
MAGKGGGAWKVAYADFVTAMMAFFMVMWLTSQSEELKEAVAEHFREPPGVFDFDRIHTDQGSKKRGRESAPRTPMFTPPPVDLEDSSKSSLPRILKYRDDDDQHVGTIIVFPHDSAELDETAQEQLQQLALLAAGKPQKIEIRGHASRRPLPPESHYNDVWQLSYARCVAVMAYLEQQGIAPERLRLSQAGAGEPFSVLPDTHRQALDSRVEIFLLAEFIGGPKGSGEEKPIHRAEPAHGE